MRISIEVTTEQHQRLKAIAVLRGKSIKDYVLDCVFPKTSLPGEDEALSKLEKFLEPRIQEVDTATSYKSVKQIFDEVHQKIS